MSAQIQHLSAVQPSATCRIVVDAPICLNTFADGNGASIAWEWIAHRANACASVRRSLVEGAELVAGDHGLSLRLSVHGQGLRETQMKLRRFERCVSRWQYAAPAFLRDVVRQLAGAECTEPTAA